MLCVFSVLVHHMHADVHASVCICMWVAVCLPQSFVTVLKFTYLFLITFFCCVHFTCNGQRRTWGTPFCVSWGSTQVERFANSDFFSLSLLFWDRVSP